MENVYHFPKSVAQCRWGEGVLRWMGALFGEGCIAPAGEGTRLPTKCTVTRGCVYVHNLKPVGVPGSTLLFILPCFKFSDVKKKKLYMVCVHCVR